MSESTSPSTQPVNDAAAAPEASPGLEVRLPDLGDAEGAVSNFKWPTPPFAS